MTTSFSKILIILCLYSQFVLHASKDIELSGRLVKKYYKAPSIVQNPAFGWFLEIDDSSSVNLADALNELDAVDKELCGNFNTNIIQLILDGGITKETCQDLENHYVKILGALNNPPHVFRPILSHQVRLEKIVDQEKAENFPNANIPSLFRGSMIVNEEFCKTYAEITRDFSDIPLELPSDNLQTLVTLQGVLQLKLYPGPPNYESIEDGDYPEYYWMLQMNPQSFDIASHTLVLEPALSLGGIMAMPNWREVQLGSVTDTSKFLENHLNQKITVQGYLSHAILAHHHVPFLMDVKNMYAQNANKFEDCLRDFYHIDQKSINFIMSKLEPLREKNNYDSILDSFIEKSQSIPFSKNIMITNFHKDAVTQAAEWHEILFENSDIRVLWTNSKPGDQEPFHTHYWKSLMIIVHGGQFKIEQHDGSIEIDNWPIGVYELPAETTPSTYTNIGSSEFKSLRFEIKN